MALDARRRQKKKERRHAKQKAKKKALARRSAESLAVRIEWAAGAPLLHCCANESLWDQGMGSVLLSRELSGRRVAFGAFLIDAYCLGVKDAWSDILPRSEYEERVYGPIFEEHGLVETTPEFARKVVEGAVDYAWGLGFPPHPDYRVAEGIFGLIDAEACTEEFTYGKNGRPFFFAGPNDRPWRCREILAKLTETCGADGFDFVMPFASSDGGGDDGILVLGPSGDEEWGEDGEDEELPPGAAARDFLAFVAEHNDGASSRTTPTPLHTSRGRRSLREVLGPIAARLRKA